MFFSNLFAMNDLCDGGPLPLSLMLLLLMMMMMMMMVVISSTV